jgi:lipopolysaccharide export system permease protein
MGSIGRYIFRTTFGAFLVVLISVTTLMWITQALRKIDLITNQGQNLVVFIGITGLIIPLLVLLIAPIALMIAVAHVLNKLSNDSELIVMNAAGMRPWRIFKPFLAVGIVVSLMVAAVSFYLSPKCLRELRRWATEVRAEVVTNNVQPGRFVVIEGTLTLHIRSRAPNGQLLGVMVDDRRDPKERVTILAEKGDIPTNDHGVYLMLENGTVQRHVVGQRDPDFVTFDKHPVDLSRLAPSTSLIRYSVQERFPWELWNPPADDPLFVDQPRQFRAELHSQFTAPLYPLAFLVITFAYLGAPRTTRQSRALSFVGALLAVSALRGLGFFGTLLGGHWPIALVIPYVVLAGAFALGLWGIVRGVIIEPPAFITNTVNALVEGMARRTAVPTGQAR